MKVYIAGVEHGEEMHLQGEAIKPAFAKLLTEAKSMKIYLADTGTYFNRLHGAPMKKALMDGLKERNNMKVALAGGITGNLFPLFTQWLEEDCDIEKALEKYSKGDEDFKRFIDPMRFHSKVSVLESFYYINPKSEAIIERYEDVLLDSGAFTLFTSGEKADWDAYVERYADFINRHHIKNFFELDIDKLVGREKVIEMTKRLEKLTNRQPIPVWHKFRGMKDFEQMCDQYPYVAIGGIVSGEIRRQEYPQLTHFIKMAHDKGCKIHGLGFTKIPLLKYLHWDSVDSTAWLSGNKFGFVYEFRNGDLVKHNPPKGKGVQGDKVAVHNYLEWVKFQQYAKTNL